MKIVREGARLGALELTLETGRMAKQAGGSVVIGYGDSQVLCVGTSGGIKAHLPFFPLVCDYIENKWASGQIPGGYLKREGRPSDRATLTSRLIDRPCRPLFPDGFMNETQLIAWVLSADKVNDTDVLAITGCSAALMISDVPWNGPVAAVRVGMVDGEFIANPTFEQRKNSIMDIVLAVTKTAITMVEGLATEVPEDIMIDALEFGQNAVQDVLDMQIRFAKAVGKKKKPFTPPELNKDVVKAVEKAFTKKVTTAVQIKDKLERYAKLDVLKDEAHELLDEQFEDHVKDISAAMGKVKKDVIRSMTLEKKKRLDGRKYDEIRDITCEVGVIPMAHGSALFTRGETQCLVTLTLGTEKEAQRIETLAEGDIRREFMLHYNFPPFCVGEVKPLRGTSRRELGHGFLAERGLQSTNPSIEEFPYTMRICSDVLESNGSSSMASVCGGSLAMYDGGVPTTAATAGIAMGMITDGKKIAILSDILGDEDHVGDMDFKVVGTKNGITAFQMDTKVEGITRKTMSDALHQAKVGRLHILDCMNSALDAPRDDLRDTAPRIVNIKIDPASIGAVIGSGGSTIRGIQEATGATINIDDTGLVSIAATDGVAAKQAIEIIEGLTQTPDVGTVYMGTVRRIMDSGAVVDLLPGTDGFLHISEITEARIDSIEDILSEGDDVLVKVIAAERNGRIKLSRKAAVETKAVN